jgi:hypothetical protein
MVGYERMETVNFPDYIHREAHSGVSEPSQFDAVHFLDFVVESG